MNMCLAVFVHMKLFALIKYFQGKCGWVVLLGERYDFDLLLFICVTVRKAFSFEFLLDYLCCLQVHALIDNLLMVE